MNVCVLDFIHAGDPVQAAFDAARSGDRVYLAGANGPPYSHRALFQAPQGGWMVRKSLEVYGDGPGHAGSHDGSTLSPGGTAATDDVFVVDPSDGPIEYVYLHGFKIRQRDTQPGHDGANGIRSVAAAHPIRALGLERINVLNLRETGFVLDALDPAEDSIERLFMFDCFMVLNEDLGALVRNVRLGVLAGCGVNTNEGGGWLIEQSAVLLLFCTTDFREDPPGPTQPHLRLRACGGAVLDACWFENFHLRAQPEEEKKEACLVEGIDDPPTEDGPVWIGGCTFGNPGHEHGGGGDTVGVRLAASLQGPVSLWPNKLTRVETMIDAAAAPAGSLVCAQFNHPIDAPPLEGVITLPSLPNKGLVASPTINRNDLTFGREFAGFIIPSMSAYSEQSPVQRGMLYYDTGNGRYRVFTNSGWRTVKTVAV